MPLEESQVDSNSSLGTSRAIVDAVIGQQTNARWEPIVSITVELFGVAPRIETMVDPEDPQETPFTVFTVCAAGEISELVDKRFQWHERVDRLQPQEHPRLSIVPTL